MAWRSILLSFARGLLLEPTVVQGDPKQTAKAARKKAGGSGIIDDPANYESEDAADGADHGTARSSQQPP